MRYVTLAEVVELHRRLIHATGGASGIRDLGMLESAVAQPKATFGGVDLYPTLIEKAAVLCFALVQGHPFVDGKQPVIARIESGQAPNLELRTLAKIAFALGVRVKIGFEEMPAPTPKRRKRRAA